MTTRTPEEWCERIQKFVHVYAPNKAGLLGYEASEVVREIQAEARAEGREDGRREALHEAENIAHQLQCVNSSAHDVAVQIRRLRDGTGEKE